MHLLCLGDSITDCGRNFSAPPLGDGYVRFLAEKLQDAGLSWRVANQGVDGFTAARILDNMEYYLALEPDVVTLLIGINDMGLMMNTGRSQVQKLRMMQVFFERYDLLASLLAQNVRHVCLLEPFVFSTPRELTAWMPWVQEMSEGIRRLAEKYNAGFAGLQTHLDEAVNKLGTEAVTIDGVHLTKTGHRILADRAWAYIQNIIVAEPL